MRDEIYEATIDELVNTLNANGSMKCALIMFLYLFSAYARSLSSPSHSK
jgi:hypothetical protein